jgi:transcription termination/antitermination protein NusG
MRQKGWYVIYTHTGQEMKVKANIERMIRQADLKDRVLRVEVPMEEEVRMVAGKRKTITRRIFPGYVLVEMRMDDQTYHLLRNTAGVTGFVGAPQGSNRGPTPLSRVEVREILKTLGDEPVRRKPAYERGETVMVLSGPFSEFTGVVDEVNAAREKLRVRMEIFGRETPVELDFAQVQKV